MRRFKAGIFQALAHPTRVAIVEYLIRGEMSVGQLCEKVGIEQANASQHLAVLRNKHIVETRKEGNQIYYRLRGPLLVDVLQTMRSYFLDHINEALQMLREEAQEGAGSPGAVEHKAAQKSDLVHQSRGTELYSAIISGFVLSALDGPVPMFLLSL